MPRAIVVAAIVLAVLGALAIRVVVEGRSALATGEEAMAHGKPAEAIQAFEASARWYMPLAPHVDDAYAGLRAIAGSKDPRVALLAWRAIRSAARATRSLWTPHAGDLAAADSAIAKLAAADPEGAPILLRSASASLRAPAEPGLAGDGSTPEDLAAREAWQQARLSRSGRPSIGATVLAALGIVLWVGGAVVLARRGIDPEGRFARRPALAAGVAIVVGLASWVLGLYNA